MRMMFGVHIPVPAKFTKVSDIISLPVVVLPSGSEYVCVLKAKCEHRAHSDQWLNRQNSKRDVSLSEKEFL